MSAAAQKLLALLDQHNIDTNSALAVETHQINALLTDLKKPECFEALEMLDLVEGYNRLFAAQEAFDRQYRKKVEDGAAMTYPQMIEYVAPIRRHVQEILDLLRTHEWADPEPFKQIIDEVNVIINDFRSKIYARKTRKQNEILEQEEVPVS
jgi:hypothetical protein